MNKRIITIPFLCALISLSNSLHSSAREYGEARFVDEFTSIDDSALKNHQDYQRWKKLILRTQTGRGLWSKRKDARQLGAKAYRFQNQLLSEKEIDYLKHGVSWFDKSEYRQIQIVLGIDARPTEVMDRREIDAEDTVIPLIQDFFRSAKTLSTVQQAIRSYREESSLALAVSDTQRSFVSELDAELPKTPFGTWFERIVGPGAGVTWQLSECGQRGEDSLAAGDIPACVEANAILPDGRRVILMIAVGGFKKGVSGPPRFNVGVIEQGGELYPVRRLRDLQNILLNPEKAVNNPAIKLPNVNSGLGIAPKTHYLELAPPWTGEDFSQLAPIEDPQTPPPPPSQGKVRQGAAVVKVQPIYPRGAKRFNASGVVEVQVTISATGRVAKAVAIRGHPLLLDAAIAAASKWEFRPTTVNGAAIETQMVLSFTFTVPQFDD